MDSNQGHEGQNGENQNENQSKIDELIDELEKLQKDLDHAMREKSNPPKMLELYPLEKCRKQIDCYKQLYKIGVASKIHHYDLYQILKFGFYAGFSELRIYYLLDNIGQNRSVDLLKTADF